LFLKIWENKNESKDWVRYKFKPQLSVTEVEKYIPLQAYIMVRYKEVRTSAY
jgi:hypothetical protein